jgi:hypothetical protein
MFIDFQPGEDTFDRQVYKEYTQMGTKVKFLVWPALFLHEGGALISKGVILCAYRPKKSLKIPKW